MRMMRKVWMTMFLFLFAVLPACTKIVYDTSTQQEIDELVKKGVEIYQKIESTDEKIKSQYVELSAEKDMEKLEKIKVAIATLYNERAEWKQLYDESKNELDDVKQEFDDKKPDTKTKIMYGIISAITLAGTLFPACVYITKLVKVKDILIGAIAGGGTADEIERRVEKTQNPTINKSVAKLNENTKSLASG